MGKTLPLFSQAELDKHSTKDKCWVTLHNRKIYDVTKFLAEHPGGSEVIEEYAGKDITAIMKDLDVHEHSDFAYDIMNENYLVGYLADEHEASKLLVNPDHVVEVNIEGDDNTSGVNPYSEATFVDHLPSAEEKLRIATDLDNDYKKHKFLDLNKPLLWQLLNAKFDREFYIDQIHRPRHYGKGSALLFGPAWLEPISKTAWWVIPTTWLPVVCYYLYTAMTNMNKLGALALFACGVFVWTFIEYCLHRFLFHFDDRVPNHPVAFTLHFLIHGCHHYLPMDKYRLVMPPTLFVVLCYPFYKAVFAIFTYYWGCAGFAGGLLGYICYDLIHYFLHHASLPRFMRSLKKYHLEHHYKNYQLGFGVSSWFWDKVFGTYLAPDSPVSKQKYD
ncbi:fatty acid alpha-hydroxylase [Hanseniaspora osmophila]|uniref:Ceramide very long chain fatty acid hydroxylase n=1 Tax=Hanseniaspora osmophila TaxID=56408 RepID=A0A1E5RYT5_9ASCO|nr:Ceramide very long chain fatty acid hydroxylase SCS7 [Hanseniaspora osmophila]